MQKKIQHALFLTATIIGATIMVPQLILQQIVDRVYNTSKLAVLKFDQSEQDKRIMQTQIQKLKDVPQIIIENKAYRDDANLTTPETVQTAIAKNGGVNIKIGGLDELMIVEFTARFNSAGKIIQTISKQFPLINIDQIIMRATSPQPEDDRITTNLKIKLPARAASQ